MSEAAAAAARRRDATKRKAAAEAANKDANMAVAEAEAALASIAAVLPDGSKPAELRGPLARRETILVALEGLRHQLIAGGGHLETDLRQALAQFDPDVAIAGCQALEDDDKELEKKGREAFAEHKKGSRDGRLSSRASAPSLRRSSVVALKLNSLKRATPGPLAS